MIREANPHDLRALYDMIEAYYKEYVSRMPHKIGFDWKKVTSMLYTWLQHDNGIKYICEGGAIVGEFGEMWFSGDPVSLVKWCYVWPEHRNGLVFRALLKRYIEESERRGALYIMWDDWVGMTDPQMLTKLLSKMGFEVQGRVHRLTLEANYAGLRHDGNDGARAASFFGSGDADKDATGGAESGG
jgi:hypothetical protein